jgi:hypothetical protein
VSIFNTTIYIFLQYLLFSRPPSGRYSEQLCTLLCGWRTHRHRASLRQTFCPSSGKVIKQKGVTAHGEGESRGGGGGSLGCCCSEPPTGSTKRDCSSYHHEKPGRRPLPMHCHQWEHRHNYNAIYPAPIPRHCRACRTVPMDLAFSGLQGVFSFLNYPSTMHNPQALTHYLRNCSISSGILKFFIRPSPKYFYNINHINIHL